MTLYEIKHRFTGRVLFSLECESFKICVEAAVESWANLTGANLTESDLSMANLTGANLTETDLTGANLTGADLTGANIDYSCLPLWCGSLRCKMDEQQIAQLLYHVESIAKYSGIDIQTVNPNSFRRVVSGELPKVRGGAA